MYTLAKRLAFAATIVGVLASTMFSRSPFQDVNAKKAVGSISGRVTNDDRPAPGVTVLLVRAEGASIERPVAKATTDHEGHFHIKGVAAGSYLVQAFAPALTAASDNVFGRQGKPINLLEGEAAEDIEILLKPGGVITGQVTDSDGQPLIQESVWLFLVSSNGQQATKQHMYLPFNFMFSTDDRGVYRLFGLPPGRYVVGVGVDISGPNAMNYTGNTFYPLTYHPDVTEEAKATIIDVASGTLASGVDIVLGRKSKVYSVSGRIVYGVSGKAIVGMPYGYGVRDPETGRVNNRSLTSSTTNGRGEFRLEGVTPGNYAAFASPNDSGLYSGVGNFTVIDSDIAGVVVKVHAGSSMTGNVAIEGADGQPGAVRLSEVHLNVSSGSLKELPKTSLLRVEPDGSFTANGLQPGMANFFAVPPTPKGLALLRIERDGVEQKNGIEVGARDDITGVRIIFAYGTGSIRGQVRVEGGDISQATAMFIHIARVATNQPLRMPPVDSRGRFALDGIQPGEYEISLTFQAKPATPDARGPATIAKNVKQTVTVANGTESQVTMVVDLSANNR